MKSPKNAAGDQAPSSHRREESDLAFGLRAFRDGRITSNDLLNLFAIWEDDPDATMAQLIQAHLAHGLAEERLETSSETVAYSGPFEEASCPFSQPAESSPTSRFQVLGLHARGGLGEIHTAIDVELDRRVALKELQARHAHDETSQLRFLQEAEITGRLEHPGIVPVYGLGRHEDGRPFYAMRFVEGETFQAAVDRFHRDETGSSPPESRALTFRRLLRSVVEVGFALGFAHSRGVVHRDVKPENIMLGRFGETLLVDWGLAKARDISRGEPDSPFGRASLSEQTSGELSSITRSGAAIGTPQYMSPEQADGDPNRIGPASDVYGLGATLYYLLVGRVPFEGGDLQDVLTRVRRGVFPSPRSVRKTVDAELEAVCLRAMAPHPADRFASPLQMAEALESWLAAIRYRDEHQSALEQVRESRSRLSLERASTSFSRGRDLEGMLWLAHALEQGSADRDHAIRTSLTAWHRRGKQLQRTVPHVGEVALLRFSPDGKRLATALSNGQVQIWDVSRLTMLGPPSPHPGTVRAMEFSRDGRSLVTGCDDGVVRRWDGLSGELLDEAPPLHGMIHRLHFAGDGSCQAYLASKPGDLPRFIDVWSGESIEIAPTAGFSNMVDSGGPLLVTSTAVGAVWTWNSNDRRWCAAPLPHPGPVEVMAVHPSGDRILTICRDGLLRIWTDGSPIPVLSLSYPDVAVWAAFSPCGEVFSVGSRVGEARLWSTKEGVVVGEAFPYDGRTSSIAFQPRGGLIAVRGRDGFLQMRDRDSGMAVGPALEAGGVALHFGFSPDGRRLIAASADGSIRSWRVPEPAVGVVERLGCWVRITTELDLDSTDAVRPLDAATGWEMRRRLNELGGPPIK